MICTRAVLIPLGAIACLACGSDVREQYRPGEARPVLEPGDAPAAAVEADSVFAIGDPTGDSPYVFGRVEDAVRLEDGTLAVLDSRMYELRFFDLTPAHVASVGREGEGPQEFADPKDVAVTDGGDVLVLDPGRPGISRWTFTDSLPTYAGSVVLPVFGESFCLLDGRLFVHALHEDEVIHELSWTGEVVRSFGDAYEPEDPGARRGRYTFIVGHIACIPEARLVVYAAATRPTVTAFTPEGQVAWSAEVPAFHRYVAVPAEGGRTRYVGEGNTGWWHAIAGVHALPGVQLGVQVVQKGYRGAEADREMVETLVYDGRSGEVVGYTRELSLLTEVRAGRAVTAAESPFPAVTVHDITVGAPE